MLRTHTVMTADRSRTCCSMLRRARKPGNRARSKPTVFCLFMGYHPIGLVAHRSEELTSESNRRIHREFSFCSPGLLSLELQTCKGTGPTGRTASARFRFILGTDFSLDRDK